MPFSAVDLKSSLPKAVRSFTLPLVAKVRAEGLIKSVTAIDHICYRVPDMGRYEVVKQALEAEAVLLCESYVNGRPIATYKLKQAVVIDRDFSLDLIELPSPKEGQPYAEGFEHIEMVLSKSLGEFYEKHSDIKFNVRNMHAAINPDISLRWPEGLVKFHEASLEAVIDQEKSALLQRARPWAAIIDLDDTLVETHESFLATFHQALEKHLDRHIPFEKVKTHAQPTFPLFAAAFGITGPQELQRLVDGFAVQWRVNNDPCTVPIGIHTMVSCLKTEGARIHIWTARDLDSARQTLAKSGLDLYVDDIHAFHSLHDSKPTPNETLKTLCQKASAVVIGDSHSDASGARELNVPFLQAAWVQNKNCGSNVTEVCMTPMQALTAALTIYRTNIWNQY